MARVGRLSGAILAESDGECFLVGNTKEPCDWAAMGFEPPAEFEVSRPFVRLVFRGPPTPTLPQRGRELPDPFRPLRHSQAPSPPSLVERGGLGWGGAHLTLDLEGEALARVLAERFIITRNGSVSERLWRLVIQCGRVDDEDTPAGAVDARWLGAMPAPMWQIVRDAVLRCI